MARRARNDPSSVLRQRIAVSLVILLLTFVVGTVGFYAVWLARGGTVMDAVYMTVITLTTVGYAEVHPLHGAGRVVAMVTALTGVASAFYLFTTVMEFLVGSQLQGRLQERRMQKAIDALRDHVVVSGFGRVGRETAFELEASGIRFVVIEPDEKSIAIAQDHGYLSLAGDATSDDLLLRAGLKRARGLVVTTGSDATNLYVVLSARTLCPTLHIVARVVDEASIPKLERAGANRAISPYALGGRRLAHLISRPTVVDFVDTALARGDRPAAIEDVEVTEAMARAGLTVGALGREHGVVVLAVVREQKPTFSPAPDFALSAGDRLFAFGSAEQLESFLRALGG